MLLRPCPWRQDQCFGEPLGLSHIHCELHVLQHPCTVRHELFGPYLQQCINFYSDSGYGDNANLCTAKDWFWFLDASTGQARQTWRSNPIHHAKLFNLHLMLWAPQDPPFHQKMISSANQLSQVKTGVNSL